eukprot:jgi/Bigna1/128025/aug1.5_g2733
MGRKYSALMSLVFVVVMLFEIKGARGGGINPSNTTKTSSYTRPRKASGNLIRSNNETVFGAQTQHIPSPPSGVVEPVVEESRTAEVKGDSLPNSESQTHAAGLLRSAVKKEKSENGRGGVEGKLILLSTHSNVRERESTGGNAQVKAPPWGKAPDWWDAPDDEVRNANRNFPIWRSYRL